ncbi:hypothetical protein BV25DRAFT_329632 [Artomyces pyxidatus]|uniref:Uncharacterized protein n=1 Tax=Artomyces pyxidatus TaxID=48021 RepID=A0ACB8T650_9AGAM|nr:hypothetical protein BV25DRAFT_329632 [Artomyces pyxidatus]
MRSRHGPSFAPREQRTSCHPPTRTPSIDRKTGYQMGRAYAGRPRRQARSVDRGYCEAEWRILRSGRGQRASRRRGFSARRMTMRALCEVCGVLRGRLRPCTCITHRVCPYPRADQSLSSIAAACNASAIALSTSTAQGASEARAPFHACHRARARTAGASMRSCSAAPSRPHLDNAYICIFILLALGRTCLVGRGGRGCHCARRCHGTGGSRAAHKA